MGYSITYNAVALSDYNLTVSPSSVPYFPAVATSVMTIPDKTGAYFRSLQETPRTITLNCSVSGTSEQNLKDNLHNIFATLNVDEPKKLEFDDYKVTETAYDSSTSVVYPYWYAVLVSQTPVTFLNKFWAQFTLNFYSPKVYAYGGDQVQTETLASGVNNFNCIVGGTADCYPNFYITCTDAGGGTTVDILNVTTDKTISWDGTLANTETLDFFLDELWKVEKEGTADMADVAGTFWNFNGGATNAIKITTDFTASVNVQWTNKYK